MNSLAASGEGISNILIKSCVKPEQRFSRLLLHKRKLTACGIVVAYGRKRLI